MNVRYAGQNSAHFPPSVGVWGDMPDRIITDPQLGTYFFDDFSTFAPLYPTNTAGNLTSMRYRAFTSNHADNTISPVSAVAGGGVILQSTTDNFATVLTTENGSFKLYNGAAQFWFEACVKCVNITDTTAGVFVGLADVVTPTAVIPIVDAGTLSSNNLLGFWRLEGDGDQFDTVFQADGQATQTVKADAIAMAADTYVRLGMKFANNTLTFYKDGVALPDTIASATWVASAATLPDDVNLGLTIGVKNAAAAQFSSTIKWWRAAQLFAPTLA